VDTLIRGDGTNISSISCPQVIEESFVSNVDWFCYGCGDNGRRILEQQMEFSSSSSAAASMSNLQLMQSAVKKVIGFGNEGRLTLLEERRRDEKRRPRRIGLDGNYGLQFVPLRTEDEGDYFCVVNGRDRPSRVTRMLVQGKGIK
jgi:hypothetical protein